MVILFSLMNASKVDVVSATTSEAEAEDALSAPTPVRRSPLSGAAGAARRFAGVADTKMREDGGGTQTPLMVTEFGQGLVLDEYMRSIGLGAGLCVARLRRLS